MRLHSVWLSHPRSGHCWKNQWLRPLLLLIKDATPPPPFLSMPLFLSPLAGDSSTQVRDQDTAGTIKAKGSELCLKHGIHARHPVYPLSSLKPRAHSNRIALSSGLDTWHQSVPRGLLQVLCPACKRESLNRPYQQPAFMCVCGGTQASSYMSKCICMCVHVAANGLS